MIYSYLYIPAIFFVNSMASRKKSDSSNYNFSAVSSTLKQVTTAVDQTLTCVIEELDTNGTPVTVTWKDPTDTVVEDSDTTNYVLSQGEVQSGVQNAELTVKAVRLASFSGQSSFTYKCSVQYSGSPASSNIDVVANVLTYGM